MFIEVVSIADGSFNSYTDKNLGSFDRIIIYEKLRKYQNMIFLYIKDTIVV